MDHGHERQHAPTTLSGVVLEFFKHSTPAVLAVAALFALIGYVYFEGTADPAGNMRHVPIAIVNEDSGATIETPIGDRELQIGDQLVGGILDNNDFGKVELRVVDRDTAESGMRAGQFYGMIEVPRSFSEDLGNLVTETAGNGGASEVPAKPRLVIHTAPRAAVTASQVMGTLTSVLQERIPSQVGDELLSNARTLAEAEGTELSPTAAVALADPISIEQRSFEPLDGGVTNPTFPLFYALILILAGFTGAMVVSQLLDSKLGYVALEVGPLVRLERLSTHTRVRVLIRKWLVTIILGPLVGIITASIARGVGVTEFPFWSTVAFSALTIMSVGFATHAINAILGNTGLIVNLIVFIVLGIPTSGGAIPTEMLPRPFVAIGAVEPMHQATTAVRAMLFYDDPWAAGLGTATTILLVWLFGALIIGLAVVSWYDAAGFERKPLSPQERRRLLRNALKDRQRDDAPGGDHSTEGHKAVTDDDVDDDDTGVVERPVYLPQ